MCLMGKVGIDLVQAFREWEAACYLTILLIRVSLVENGGEFIDTSPGAPFY